MGQHATIHAIDQAAWEAASRGDVDSMTTVEEIKPLHLETAWHAIHFVLTGNTDLTFLGTGSQLDLIPEHCEAHPPESVHQLAAGVKAETHESLLRRIDPKALECQRIYVWDESPEFFAYLSEHLANFLQFLHSASIRNHGLLVIIT